MTQLDLKNLIKIYDGKKVVDTVSLIVKQGEVTGLLGPNGAGKTTTFYMTIGLIKPDGGTVLIDKEGDWLSSSRIKHFQKTDGETEYHCHT